MLAIILGSCATNTQQPHKPSRLATDEAVAGSGHWVKIRSNPPTWYPRGTCSDCPTDFRSGEWVATGGRDDVRFFIPFHVAGEIPRKTLLKEALAARAPDEYQPPTGEKCASLTKVIGNIVVGPPLFLMTLAALKYGPPHEKLTADQITILPFDP